MEIPDKNLLPELSEKIFNFLMPSRIEMKRRFRICLFQLHLKRIEKRIEARRARTARQHIAHILALYAVNGA